PDMAPALITHLEAHLGQIQGGWQRDPDKRKLLFQIVRFAHGPVPGTKALTTLGLSNHPLKSRVSEKIIRCELVMLVRNGSKSLPGILQQVAMEMLQSRFAVLRGDVLGPRGPLVDGSKMQALYASNPVYFPETFAACRSESLGTIIFIWL